MGRSMLAIACAVLVGAAGYAAAVLAAGADDGTTLGLFFCGPLGSLIGYAATERAMKKAGGFRASVLARVLLLAVVYGALVYGGVVLTRR